MRHRQTGARLNRSSQFLGEARPRPQNGALLVAAYGAVQVVKLGALLPQQALKASAGPGPEGFEVSP